MRDDYDQLGSWGDPEWDEDCCPDCGSEWDDCACDELEDEEDE